MVRNVGRNDPCPCGSGKKHKRCCLGKTVGQERAVRVVLKERADRALRLMEALQQIQATCSMVHKRLRLTEQVSVLENVVDALDLDPYKLPEQVVANVLWHYAMFGRSLEDIDEKQEFQELVRAALSTKAERGVYAQLTNQAFQAWFIRRYADDRLKGHPLVGPAAKTWVVFDERILFGVSVECSHVLGFPIRFEDKDFFIGLAAISDASVSKLPREASPFRVYPLAFWDHFELRLIGTIADPHDDYAYGYSTDWSWQSYYRPSPHRLWERVKAEVRKPFPRDTCLSTLVAKLVDASAVDAFCCKLETAHRAVMREYSSFDKIEDDLTIDQVRRYMFCDPTDIQAHLEELMSRPLAVLLDEAIIDELIAGHPGMDRRSPIGEAMTRASSMTALQEAWAGYVTEQRWCKLTGMGPDDCRGDDGVVALARHEILNTLSDVVDPRFWQLPLGDLPMAKSDKKRLLTALHKDDPTYPLEVIGDLPLYDDKLHIIAGIGDVTRARLMEALVILVRSWRWSQAGLDPEDHATRHTTDPVAKANAQSGLDDLADLFGSGV